MFRQQSIFHVSLSFTFRIFQMLSFDSVGKVPKNKNISCPFGVNQPTTDNWQTAKREKVNNGNGTKTKTKTRKWQKQKPNARVDITELCEYVVVAVIVVVMPQSLFSTLPMQQQWNASNFCCCLMALVLGHHPKRTNVFLITRTGISLAFPFRYLWH